MNRYKVILAVGCLALLAVPRAGFAQDAVAGEDARFHVGPVAIQPTISLTNFGRDTNILNSHTGQQGDFTATFIPGANAWLRLGRAQLTSRSTLEYLYFQTAASQRSFGGGEVLKTELALTRVTPYVTGQYGVSSQRPNAEIDARVRQTTKGGFFGFKTILGSRTTLDLAAGKTWLAVADVAFLGVSLAQQLSHASDNLDAKFSVVLTPLTTFTFRTSLQQDRFDGSTERNSNSVSALWGLDWTTLALISGSANVGYKRFHALAPGVPSFRGLIADVNVAYIYSDMTKFNVTTKRNVDYSVELTQPYFVTTSSGIAITQALAGHWDCVGRYARAWLHYQDIASPGVEAPARRIDRENTLAVGLGYRMANQMRIGIDVSRVRRLSALAERQFKGYQIGGSFTYGG